ncbi:double homeobox protein A-like [Rhopilema esculentum]|uniref:double homeobox protein A-like n=1 Tax=Rhopilema esculentum TaxID=499914 RepID=UPI0031E2EAD8
MADFQWHGYSLYRPIQRSKFSEKQQEILAKCFDKNQYPDHSLKVKISKKTGLDAEQVRIWFQNKRARKRSGMVNEEPQKHVLRNEFNEEKDKQSFSVAEKKADGVMTSSSQEVVELLHYVNEIINALPQLAVSDGAYFFQEESDDPDDVANKELKQAVQRLLA